MAVRVSLREDALAAAPAGYLRTLRRGARLFTVGTVLSFPLLFFGLVPAAAGAWLLTTRQPDREDPAKEERLRWITRGLLAVPAVGLAGLMAAFLVALVFNGFHVFRLTEWRHLDALLIAGCGLFWMGLITLSAYLDGLAERTPEKDLARAVRAFRRHWLAGLGVIILVALAAQVADWVYRAQNVYFRWAAPAFAVVAAAVLLWLWVASVRFGVRLRRGLPAPADS